MGKVIGPTFPIGSGHTVLADGTEIHSVYANGKAPLDRRADEPAGIYIGRVWKQGGYGWVAAPKRYDDAADSWSDEVTRSTRHFRTRKDACLYLYGYMHAMGAVKRDAERVRLGI